MTELPEPYYHDEESGITIYHGDAREILPLLPKVDLVLTDPPYGIGEHGGHCRTRGKAIPNHECLGWDNETPSQEVFDLIFDKSHDQAIFGANYFSNRNFPPRMGWVYWDKRMGGDFSDGELIFLSLDRALKCVTVPQTSVDRVHPTQKPTQIVSYIFSRFPDAQTILDPFMGSGTTLVAAKQLGRKAIGIEIEEAYCRIAVERLAQKVMNFE